jgi:hypothetical protein
MIVRRDGTVVYNGTVVGRVWGEPRAWWNSEGDGPWHSKREAAEMCVRESGALATSCRSGAPGR